MSATYKTSKEQSFASIDVVKQGYLYIKRPPGNPWNKIKAWHKRYFILRNSNGESSELLMYNSINEAKSSVVQLHLYLRETIHIGIASESHRFPNVLVVVFNGRSPLLLAAEDELTARSWMLALDLTSQRTNSLLGNICFTGDNPSGSASLISSSLMTVNSSSQYPTRCSSQASGNTASGSIESDGSNCSCAPMFVKESPIISSFSIADDSNPTGQISLDIDQDYKNIGDAGQRYEVCFEHTEAAERVGLHGKLQLVLFTFGLGVARIGDLECFITWPVFVIRQYRLQATHKLACYNKSTRRKSKSLTRITLEVGRRCSTGEGIFCFTTTQGEEIMREIKKAVSNWADHKAKANNSSLTKTTRLRTGSSRSSLRNDIYFTGVECNQSAPCTPALNRLFTQHRQLQTSVSNDMSNQRGCCFYMNNHRPQLQALESEHLDERRPSASLCAKSTVAGSKTKDLETRCRQMLRDNENYITPVFNDSNDEDGNYIEGIVTTVSFSGAKAMNDTMDKSDQSKSQNHVDSIDKEYLEIVPT